MKDTLVKLVSGNFASQIIGILSVPLMLTSYSVEDVGVYGAFVAASSILSIIFSVRVDNLFYSLSDIEARYLKKMILTSLLLLLAFSSITWLAVSGEEKATLYCLWIFGGVCIAFFNVNYAYTVRIGQTNKYVISKIARNLLELLGVLLCIALEANVLKLCCLVALSYILASLVLESRFTLISWQEIRLALKIFRKNSSFIKYDFAATIFGTTALYIPVLYFYIKDESAVAGVYFSISKFIGTPVLMIAQSIGTALKQHAAEEFSRTGSCKISLAYIVDNVLKRFMPLYLSALFVVILVIYLWSRESGSLIFEVSLCVVPLCFIRFLFNCISSIVYVLKLQKENLLFQLLLVLTSGVAISVAPTALSGIVLYAMASACCYILFLLKLIKH